MKRGEHMNIKNKEDSKKTSGIYISEEELNRRVRQSNVNSALSLLALCISVATLIRVVIHFSKCW